MSFSEFSFHELLRMTLTLILMVLLITFAYQNMAEIELTVFNQTVQSRRIVVIGASFAVGLVIGWLHGRRHPPRRTSRRSRSQRKRPGAD